MSCVRTKYIVYERSGSGVRHHHFTTSNEITGDSTENYPGATDSNPGSNTAHGWRSLPFNGKYVPFAFMSVHRAADGNHLYTTPGDQNVLVGSSDVDVLVVYAPPGGIGVNGGPGIWVDAFNLDTGDFSDDLHFITVLTPPTPPDNIDNAKTSFANSDGGVSTQTPEHLRASGTIDGGVPFLEWEKAVPVESTQSGEDVDIAAKETGEIWFAFYQTPNSPNVVVPNVNQTRWIYVSPGVLVDGGGIVIGPDGVPHPVDPWGPLTLTAKLMTTVGILSLATNMDKEERVQAVRLASAHLESVRSSIETMEF